jgi:hypothetical protein
MLADGHDHRLSYCSACPVSGARACATNHLTIAAANSAPRSRIASSVNSRVQRWLDRPAKSERSFVAKALARLSAR